MSHISSKKIIAIFAGIALSAVAIQALAIPSFLAKDSDIHLPLHLKSTHATPKPAAMSPIQIKTAYGIPSNFQGAGETIALVEAYDDPNIEADLGVFSTQYGLPACTIANGCLTKLYPSGSVPTGDQLWAEEISLDVEWAHAIAPAAKILLIEQAADQSIFDAVTFAIQQKPSVISISWDTGEFDSEHQLLDPYFMTTIPIVVASGDSGAGVLYPAASPYVISAGGTQLTVDADGNYVSETAWSGSGGGVSLYETEPVFQSQYVIAQPNGMRGVPDVAWNASPASGYAIYDTYENGGWLSVGGTSASAPQWAALIALMKSAKQGTFNDFDVSIYSVARENGILHNITTGTNGGCGYYCTARSGYNYVTGLGTPYGANLINRFD